MTTATLKAVTGAQYVQEAIFVFDLSIPDAMANTSGTVQAMNATGAGPFDVIPLPYGAQVVGGDITVLTVGNDSGTQTLAVGDSASAARYLAATNIKAAALTALVPTGYVGLGEAIRLTLVNSNGDATTGKVRVKVQFVIDGRVTENLKTY